MMDKSDIPLQIKDLLVKREGVTVLSISSLEIKPGETLAVIGPNGAGKSTLLHAINGLIPITQGEIVFFGKQVIPSKDLNYRRRLALVMQSPLLLHTSVAKNIATGLRFRGMSSQQIKERVDKWMDLLAINSLGNRPAHRLSGGEGQRVNLARALVLEPDLFLLDEPFSALDAPTRSHLLLELKKLLRNNHVTSIFVTHDLDEALVLGDRVALLIDGELRQIGPPDQVFTAPIDLEVARFVGVETTILGKVISLDDGMMTLETGTNQKFEAVGEIPPGRMVYICLRPEDFTLSHPDQNEKTSARNRITGRITSMSTQGALVKVAISGETQAVALITRSSAREMELQEGSIVSASFKASAAHIIEKG